MKKIFSFIESALFTPVAILLGIAVLGGLVYLIRNYAPHGDNAAAETIVPTEIIATARDTIPVIEVAEDQEDGSMHFSLSAPADTVSEEEVLPPIGDIPDSIIYYRTQYGGAVYENVEFSVNGDELCIGIPFDVNDNAVKDAHIEFTKEDGSCSFTNPAVENDAPDYLLANGNIDLTAFPKLYVSSGNGYTYVYHVTYKRLECDLPVLYLYTDDGANVTSRDEYVSAHMTLDGTDYEMKIRGRGNVSWTRFPQKAYMLKFSEPISFFDMRRSNKWVLIPTYSDPSLIRNPVAMAIAGYMTGMEFTPAQIPVDVFLNGEYIGIYTFSEKIEVASGKIELFEDTTPEYVAAGDNATTDENADTGSGTDDGDADTEAANAANDTADNDGANDTEGDTAEEDDGLPEIGFMIELGEDLFGTHIQGQEYFWSPYLPQVYVRYPTFDEPNTPEFNYISDYMRQTGQAIVSGHGYEDYIDMESWVDWFIVMELTNNTDSAFCRSTFLYKRPGEKLMLGPVWDFDMAMGHFLDNPSYAYWATAEAIYTPAQGHYMSYLYNSDAFMQAVQERWDECKEELLQTAFDAIDTYGAQVARSREYNNKLWGYRGSEAQVTYLHTFIQRRYDWIDLSLHLAGYNRHPATISTYGEDIMMQLPAADENGNPILDENGRPVMILVTIPRNTEDGTEDGTENPEDVNNGDGQLPEGGAAPDGGAVPEGAVQIIPDPETQPEVKGIP